MCTCSNLTFSDIRWYSQKGVSFTIPVGVMSAAIALTVLWSQWCGCGVSMLHPQWRWVSYKSSLEQGTRSRFWSTVSNRGTHVAASYFMFNAYAKYYVPVPSSGHSTGVPKSFSRPHSFLISGVQEFAEYRTLNNFHLIFTLFWQFELRRIIYT